MPTWVFTGTGVGLYADFEGVANAGSTSLNWQAHWYTYTRSADNPNPYAFVLPGSAPFTWANVLQRFWQDTPVNTVACLSRLSAQLRQTWLPLVIR